ncbi:MAG TPA: sigma-54 dependent transcriptional regulator [Dissulfurispiraceae bacterium]|nr:sigma-54 dependent transcriptional regulator [Dissulfurispiraceae bacterium]
MTQTKDMVLLVDDEERIRKNFAEILEMNGFAVMTAADGVAALNYFSRERPDAVLLDMNLPDRSGMEIFREMKALDASVPVIFVTAYGNIPSAVEAIKEGAYDFIAKPPDFDRLVITIRRAVEKRHLEKNVRDLNAAYQTSLEFMLGSSFLIRQIISQLKQVALSDYAVIIQGETGTGKTYLANIIHNLSRRASGPFVKVSIGSIPDTLTESELFGFEKGAFTGADRLRKGYFESAGGGTIFLDDMDNITPFVQGKLLSVIEDKRIYRIGSTKAVPADVRIVSATNRDLSQGASTGTFRQDLLFRLGEFVLHLPPLRERAEDIPFFSRKFLIETCTELSKQIGDISPEALTILKAYSWPGNLRQLKNVIRRAVLLSPDGILQADNLQLVIEIESRSHQTSGYTATLSIKDAEKTAIRRALEQSGGKRTKAAALLQVDYKTLLRKIKEYELDKM